MKKYLKRTIFLVGFLLSAAGYAASNENILPAFTAQYDLYHGDSKIGSSTKQLSYPKPGAYSYTANTDIVILMTHQNYVESSEGLINAQGFKPTNYKLLSGGKITYQNSNFQNDQDNLSQELMLRYFLATNQIPSTLSVTTAKGTELYNFNIIQTNETISTPAENNIACTHVRFFDHENK